MGNIKNKKVWAMLLVVAMITTTFAGISVIVTGSDATPDPVAKIQTASPEVIAEALKHRQPVNENILNKGSTGLKTINEGPEPMSPPPAPETQGTWAYDFEGDTPGAWPATPPWQAGQAGAAAVQQFGPDDFEDDVLNGLPDSPPWTSNDGDMPQVYWGVDFEDLPPDSSDIDASYFFGDAGCYWKIDVGCTLTSETPPAGTVPGSIHGALTTGSVSAHMDQGGGADHNYYGPIGFGDTPTNAFAGGWVYMSVNTQLNFILGDVVGGDIAEIVWWDGGMEYYDGAAFIPIPGPSWSTNEWHEMFVQYDEPTQTWSMWWDGAEYAAGTPFKNPAAINADFMIWYCFGTLVFDVDNFYHFEPPAGLPFNVEVTNAQAQSGSQSVTIDQSGVAAPDIASFNADLTPPLAGTGYWDFWFRTGGDANGAVAALYDQTDNAPIAIRCNAGQFQRLSGGWANMQAFGANTWYHFNVTFDTVTKTYTVNIDASAYGPFAFDRESGTLAGVIYRATGGTQSECYIDDVEIYCAGSAEDISVTDVYAHGGNNGLRFQEYNSDPWGEIYATNLGAGTGGVGTFSFWFYNTENGGGQLLDITESWQTNSLTMIGLGANLATGLLNTGVVQFVDYDGGTHWVVDDGITYLPNEWHQITINFDCTDLSVNGVTGSYTYQYDGGAPWGPYGMSSTIAYVDTVELYGGAPGCYGDFVYDDFNLFIDQMPGAPTNCWAEPPGAGAGTYDNYTVNGQFLDHGTITGGDWMDIDEMPPGPPDGATEDIEEIAFGGDIWNNYTVASDIAVEGTVTNDWTFIDENPPTGDVETVEEILNPGGSGVATYDFLTTTPGDPGVDCWFYEQINEAANPPGSGPDVAGETELFTYTEIESSNNVDHLTAAGNGVYGVTHFKFTIAEPVVSITQIDFLWEGESEETGAWWYAWNFGTSGWELLGQLSGTDIEETLTATRFVASDYIDGSGLLHMIATDLGAGPDRDILTDYTNVAITYTTPPSSSLEHKWTTNNIPAGYDALNLYVRALSSAPADDVFSIFWSNDDISYFDTGINIDQVAMTTYAPFTFPLGESGVLYIQVIDDNTGDVALTTVEIDTIRLEWYQNIPLSVSLEKRWSTEAIAASPTTLDLYVRARHNAGSDDTFTFGYSTVLAGPYTGVITVNTAIMTTYTVPIPVMSGSIYINVVDDNPGDAQQDTIYVDTIWIEYYQGGGSVTTTQITTADIPIDGTVTGTHVLTNPPADGSAQEIAEVAATKSVGDDPIDLAPGPGPTPTIVLYGPEDMTGGIPGGWSVYDAGGSVSPNNWFVADATGMGPPFEPPAPCDGWIAWINYPNGAYNNKAFDSPTWDFSTYQNIQLSFYMNRLQAGMDENIYVEVSTDGGGAAGTWNLAATYPASAEGWVQHFVDISAWADLQSSVDIRFRYEGTVGESRGIDYVQVDGDVAGNTLEHRWQIEDMPADSITRTLYVTARHNTGSDDTFSFEWSEDQITWNPTTITVNTDGFVQYSDSISVAFVGPLYVRVLDDNGGDATIDSVFVDEIYVESEVSAVSTDIIIHWDLSADDGAGENDIVQYNIYRADEEDGDGLAGPYTFVGSSPAGLTTYNDVGEGADLVNQAWYYVEAEDAAQTNASGYFSKLNFAPVVSNVLADGTSPILIISPGTPTVDITADASDNSSQYEAIPKMHYAEMFVNIDPGEGAGQEIFPVDATWDTTTEALLGTIDTSMWAPGTYFVYVRAAEDHTLGAMGSVVYGTPVSVQIDVVDGPPIADAGPDQTVAQHTLVMFDGIFSTDDVGITNYWWNFTDGGPQTLTGVNPTYTFDNEGIYTVTLEVADTIGQTDTDIMLVNVTDGDPPVANAGLDQGVIPGALVNFDGTASYDPNHLGEPIIDGIVNWTWDFVDGVPQQYFGPNPSHTFNTPGSYLVTLTVTDNAPVITGGPYTDTDTMYVNVTEVWDIDISEAALSDNWILVSFPNDIEGDPLVIFQDLVGDTQWDVVQWFDPQSPAGQEWKTTATFKPPALNDFNYVNRSFGFWVHISVYGDGIIQISGNIADSGEQVDFYLHAGWNLIGYPFEIPQEMGMTFGMLGNIDIFFVGVYDSSDPYRLQWLDAFEFGLFTHVPGRGYWVHIVADEIMMMLGS